MLAADNEDKHVWSVTQTKVKEIVIPQPTHSHTISIYIQMVAVDLFSFPKVNTNGASLYLKSKKEFYLGLTITNLQKHV
jgi:hypothetical protein